MAETPLGHEYVHPPHLKPKRRHFIKRHFLSIFLLFFAIFWALLALAEADDGDLVGTLFHGALSAIYLFLAKFNFFRERDRE